MAMLQDGVSIQNDLAKDTSGKKYVQLTEDERKGLHIAKNNQFQLCSEGDG